MVQVINILKLICILVIPILTFKLIKYSLSTRSISRFAKIAINKSLKGEGYFSYDGITKKIKSTGMYEVFGKDFTPSSFILVKILSSILFLMLGISLEFKFFSIIFMIFGFFAFDLLVMYSNSSDNEKMQMDLKIVYDTLRIQSKAGVFLTKSIAECYLVVRNPRLKKALLELNAEIITNTDILQAIENFNSKFDNYQIDQFCIVIKQSIESGQKTKILEDLADQIKDIEEGLAIKEAAKRERKIEFIQLLIYIGIIAITVYAMVIELGNSFMNF